MSQAGLQARAGSPDPSRGTVRTLHAVLGVYKRVNKAQSRRQTHTCAKNGTLRWAWLCFTSLGWSCASGARSDSGVPGRSGVNCNLGRRVCVCLWLCAAPLSPSPDRDVRGISSAPDLASGRLRLGPLHTLYTLARPRDNNYKQNTDQKGRRSVGLISAGAHHKS